MEPVSALPPAPKPAEDVNRAPSEHDWARLRAAGDILVKPELWNRRVDAERELFKGEHEQFLQHLESIRMQAAAFVRDHPELLAASPLTKEQKVELYTASAAAHTGMVVVMTTPNCFTIDRGKIDRLIAKGLGTVPEDETVKSTRLAMIREAAPLLAGKYPRTFLDNFLELRSAHGTQEGSIRADVHDQQNAITRYLHHYHPDIEQPEAHARSVLGRGVSVDKYLKELGKEHNAGTKAISVDRIVAEFAHESAVARYYTHLVAHDKYADLTDSSQRFHDLAIRAAYTASESAPGAFFDHFDKLERYFPQREQLKSLVEKVAERAPASAIAGIEQWQKCFSGEEKRVRAIVAKALPDAIGTATQTFAWLEVFKDHPDELEAIVEKLPKESRQTLVCYLNYLIQEHPEQYPKLRPFEFKSSAVENPAHPFATLVDPTPSFVCAEAEGGHKSWFNPCKMVEKKSFTLVS